MSSRSREVFLRNKTSSDFEIGSHISLKNSYVFVQVSKAASSSVKWVLQSLEFAGSPWKPTEVNNRFLSPHVCPYQLPPAMLDEVFYGAGFKRAAFVRNPFTRLLSCYLHRVVAMPDKPTNQVVKKLTGGRGGSEVSFDEFVELICPLTALESESHWRCQAEDICFDDIDYDFVGKVEALDTDLPRLVELLYGSSGLERYHKMTAVDASPMKTGAGQLLRDYYRDRATVVRVQQRFRRDFELFGYDTELPC